MCRLYASKGEFHTHPVNKNHILRFVKTCGIIKRSKALTFSVIYILEIQCLKRDCRDWAFIPAFVIRSIALPAVFAVGKKIQRRTDENPHCFNNLPCIACKFFNLNRTLFIFEVNLLYPVAYPECYS